MTEEQIKEQLSQRYVELIACRNGFKCSKPSPDSGVDLAITRSRLYERDGRRRFIDTGQYIELQLKATCESNIAYEGQTLKYDLEAKAYNDLVDRQNSGGLVPLYLVVLVLPDDPASWLTATPDELALHRTAYWFIPASGTPRTENTATKRIEVPVNQSVGLSFLEDRFLEVYG